MNFYKVLLTYHALRGIFFLKEKHKCIRENDLNSKSFKKITKNKEVVIEIPKSKSFLIVVGRSSGSAGRNIYAGSSNADGIYAFCKIAGAETDLSVTNDSTSMTFTSSAWIEAMYATT